MGFFHRFCAGSTNPHGLHERIGTACHFSLLGRGPVIVSEEVKEPVGEQKGHFIDDGAIVLTGLTGRGGQGDHDIPEEPGRSRGLRPVAHGKGENVGGFVDLAIAPVEVLDRRVVAQKDRQLGVL